MAKKNSNVLYYEPNYINYISNSSEMNQSNAIELPPNMEDYCIVVDLEVEVPIRPIGGKINTKSIGSNVNNTDSYFLIRYSSSMDGDAKLSFNQGKKYKGSSKNYLTTEPYELGTFNDIQRTDGTTTEMFGINSIDIEYNNYMVPVVTIKFTDIRGLSLFANEDLRHNRVSEDGISYSVNDEVYGSFFKCFFTFPYPKFKIIVKGFYGRPVSYELTCSDFRANFDSSTGNFGATAKFVGYSFSVLNDLTMASLLASPYSEYFGKKYWENHEDKFVFSDGIKMRPLLDVIKSVDGVIGELKKYEKDEELDKSQEILNSILRIKDAHINYYNKLQNLLNSSKINIYVQEPFFICSDVSESNHIVNNLDSYYNILKNLISSFNTLNNQTLKIPDKFGSKKKKLKELKGIHNIPDRIIGRRRDEYYYYDGTELGNSIFNLEEQYRNFINQKNNEINEKKNDKIEDAIGFKPSVKNITELLLAHIETFVHEVYACAENVKTSNIINERYENNSQKKDNRFYAFPNVVKNQPNNGQDKRDSVRKMEKTWIGEFDSNAPEAKLVNSLLEATNIVTKTIKNTSEKIINDININELQLNVEIPVVPFDYLANSNPYYNVDLFSNDDIFGKAFIRAAIIDNSVIFNGDWNTLVREIGKADALNFYKNNTDINDTFRYRVNSTYTTENVIQLLSDYNRTSTLSDSNNAIWKTNDSLSNALIKSNALSYESKFFINGSKCILPINEFDWDDLSDLITNGNMTDNSNFYTQGFDGVNNNLFILEKDWTPFNSFMKSTSQDTPNLNKLYDIYFNQNQVQQYYGRVRENKSIIGKVMSSSINNINDCNVDYAQIIPLNSQTELSHNKYCLYESTDEIIEIQGKNNLQLASITNEDFESLLTSTIDNESYSLRFLCGYDKHGRISNITSVFGQIEYYHTYANVGKEAAALMVLNTFDWDYNMLMDALNRNNFNYIPYLFAVSIGGYYYRYDNPEKFKYQKLNDYENDFEGYDADINERLDDQLLSNDLPQSFFNIRNEIKEAFKKLFVEWVNDSFIKIHDQLSLKLNEDNDYNGDIKKFIVDFVNKFRGNVSNFRIANNTISFLRKNLQNNFFTNYMMVQCCTETRNYSLKLIHRENSEIVKALFKQLLSNYLMINSIRYPFTDINKVNSHYRLEKVNVNTLKSYLDGFLYGLKNNLPKIQEINSSNNNDFKTHEQIKLSYYNYLKIIWDRWLSGNPKIKGDTTQWDLDIFKERWHYLDSFYNKLTDQATINIFDFIQDISNAFDMIGSSALSIMSTTYARSRFVLMCVQNFNSMINDELMSDMFKPIPYNQIDFNNVKDVPDFIVMYTNEPSSKLDIANSSFDDDSYLIGGDDLPLPILTKTQTSGYKIPAFGVTYGGQYQSYFTNIEVGMEKPQVTDQSLQAQFALAKIGENGSDGIIIGQDLFTIYSNQSYTCTVTMMGCAWVQPLMYFQLNNVPMFKGTYLIQKVVHHISAGKMDTVFTGTRMSKYSTQFVKNGLIINDNDQNGNTVLNAEDVEGKKASIYNNCQYKYFSPLNEIDNVGMDNSELEMLVKDYGEKYGGWKIDMSSKEDKTMAELFADIAFTEAHGLNDELSYKLVLTVIFNRYMAVGKNFVKVLYNDQQHEFYKNYDDEKYVKYAKDIFTKTPLILVGQKTYVKPLIIGEKVLPSPIWNYNQKSNENICVKTITEHDVKSMDMYCTSRGYNTNYKNPRKKSDGLEAIPPSSEAYWHMGKYVLEHDTEERFGHVLVSVGFGKNNKPDSEHWKISKKSNNTYNNEKPSVLCKSLFNSIKQTIDYSDSISIDNIGIIPYDSLSNDTFRIKSNPTTSMGQVFDIILNTYYDHFSELYWVVNNSSDELPMYIQIKALNNAKKRIVAVAKEDLSKNNKLSVINQYKNLNNEFYISLQKKYNPLNIESSLFKVECLNFASITSKNNWENEVKQILNKEIADCPTIDNNSDKAVENTNNSKYSWKGSDHLLNKKDPIEINSKFDALGASLYAKNNITGEYGNCATYVRTAMEKGGHFNIGDNHPYSACCYVKFLPHWGFKLVYRDYVGNTATNFEPKNGDIAVIAGISNEGDKQKHGHIQIYNDGYWYSDFKCKTMWCYNDNGRPYQIYRWSS